MADQGAEGLFSPFLRRRRFAAARPFLEGNVLDFGCGAGGLAEYVPPDHYLGVEIDPLSLQRAQSQFSFHKFTADPPDFSQKFDTVVSGARLIITTPHPSVDWVHDIGATLGLFSKHANEEHEDLLDYSKLKATGIQAGLKLVSYRRFLLGANQLAVFKKGNG